MVNDTRVFSNAFLRSGFKVRKQKLTHYIVISVDEKVQLFFESEEDLERFVKACTTPES